MNLKERIGKDFISARKEKDEAKIAVLTLVKSAVRNMEIDSKSDANNEDVVKIISKEIKQRKDSAAQYKDGGRDELAKKEEAEIKILQEYLPEQMDEAKLSKLIDEIIKDTSASGMSDMGKVMGAIMPKIQGKADGNQVKEIVSKKLSQSK